jgi:hypothetical protein
MAQSLLAIVDYRQSLFAMFPRDLARTAWKQDLEQRLHQRDLFEERVSYRRDARETTSARHPSPIIRTLIRGSRHGMVLSNLHDIFLVIYLMARPEASQLTLPRSAQSFVTALQREQSRA